MGAEFYLHIAPADNLALEGGSERHRNRKLGYFDLDAPQLQRLLHGIRVIRHRLQSARNLILSQVDVYNYRESKSDGSCSCGYHYLVDRAEGVDEGGNSLLCISQQSRQIARRQVAEDQRRADSHRHHMDDRGHVMAQRDDTKVKAHLYAALRALLDYVAYHKGHDALALVILHDVYHILRILRLAQHNRHARDIAGNQRHAQGTDHRVRNEADSAVIRVRIRVVHILQSLQDLSAHRCGKAGVQGLSQILLVANQALQHAHTGREIAQLRHLHARGRIDGRQEVSGVRHRYLLVLSILRDGVIHSTLRESRHRVRALVNQISQHAHNQIPP